MKNKYYNLEVNNNIANLYIYGDITSWPWLESDVSAYMLSSQLENLTNVDILNVYINSYGGEVAEGIAIYNALKRFSGLVKTYADGFVCSIASVIFMAGHERIVNRSSALLIHNAWTYGQGDANALRKVADDLDVINDLGIKAYMEHINISQDELQEMLDKETWLNSEKALEYGFATSIEENNKSSKFNQSYKDKVIHKILNQSEDDEGDSNDSDSSTTQSGITSVTISIEDGELKVVTNDTIEDNNSTEDDDVNNTDSEDNTNDTSDEDNGDESNKDDEKNKSSEKLKQKLLNVFKEE